MLSPLLCLALTTVVSPAAAPQDPVDPLACVPADALVVLTIKDIEGLKADGSENAWYQMSQDQEFAPLLDAVREYLGWEKAPDEDEVVRADLLRAVHGSFTIYLLGSPEYSAGAFRGGLVFDPGPDRAEFESIYEELIAAKVDKSVASYESYAGLDMVLMEDDPASGEPAAGAMLFIATEQLFFLLDGSSTEAVLAAGRTTVDQFQGESEAPGFAINPLLLEARGGEQAPGRIELFVNTHALAGAMPDETLAQFEPEQAQAVFSALGLSQMTWAYAWMDLGEAEQADFEFSLRIPDEGYVRDWASYCMPAPQQLAGLVPADSSTVVLWGYDVWEFYQSAWDLFEEVSPEGYEQARMQFDAFAQMIGGLDIEQDLIAQFTGASATFSAAVPEAEWLATQGALATYGPGEVPEDLLFGTAVLIGMQDSDLVSLTVEDLMDFAGMMGLFDPMAIESEEFQGLEIQSLEMPTGGTFSWCFDGDLFVFSAFPSALRSVLRLRGTEGAGSALEDPDLIPYFTQEADAVYLGLNRSKQMVRSILETFRMLQGMLPDPGDLQAPDCDNDLQQDEFNWEFMHAPIPSPSVADRYLKGMTVSTMRFEGNVLSMRVSMR